MAYHMGCKPMRLDEGARRVSTKKRSDVGALGFTNIKKTGRKGGGI